MDLAGNTLVILPEGWWLATLMLGVLVIEAAVRIRQRWAVPALMVYVTIFSWYIIEPIYSPATMQFSEQLISQAFFSVFVFLVAFRCLCPVIASMMVPSTTQKVDSSELPAERVLWGAFALWFVLILFGIYRMEGDVFHSLFPIEARAGVSMWQRSAGADAGPFGFVVATASYIYSLVLALFGMLLPLLRKRWLQLFCIGLILLTWPYAFLQGARNVALAVVIPCIFSFLYFARVRLPVKLGGIAVAGVALEWALRQIVEYRNYGFDYAGDLRSEGHLGLNMASELTYGISFLKDGVLQQQNGGAFLAELANMIPRFMWPGKPLIGVDFAIARGYGTISNDIGVNTTISTGIVGQGVLDFGPYLGPIFAALLMALWSAWLARLWSQGTVLRACLFLLGIGLTFNLGRNITLLVLWPMVFAYILILVLERFRKRGKPNLPDRESRLLHTG